MASNIRDPDIKLFQTDFSDKALKSMDEILRCRICCDYFTNCMVTKCSHNYCSVCIRRYMLYKAQCPTCFKDASEPELRSNRLVDEILRIYLQLKDTLLGHKETEEPPFSVFIESPSPSQSSSQYSESEDSKAPSSSKTISKKTVSDVDFVSCPVCFKPVPVQRINNHLDTCLESNECEETSMRKKPLPKLVYHLLSDKEIRKKLREHTLSISGDRQALIRRHKNFVVLYNSNLDSLNPKPVSDIVKELEMEEGEEKMHSAPKEIQVHKKSDTATIEKEHESYIRRHQSQFSALIQNIQERQFSKEYCDMHNLEEPFPENVVKVEINSDEESDEMSPSVSAPTMDDLEVSLDKSPTKFRKRKTEGVNEGRSCSPKKM